MGANAELRQVIHGEVFDYGQLSDCLRAYAKPRDKIAALLRSGEIVRVKKGLYVFGKDYRRGPWVREILANLIYGPSYISLQYALFHYGMIPESVPTLTSVTLARSRRFDTPLGQFTYRSLATCRYHVGIDQQEVAGKGHFLIASPAKALADAVWVDARFRPRSARAFESYLEDDLRIDPAALEQIDLDSLSDVAAHYQARKIELLTEYMHTRRGRR